jgi:hypothetical protein
MNPRQRELDLTVPCDLAEVLRMMGWGQDRPVPDRFRALASDLLVDTRDSIRPRGVYTICPVERMTSHELALLGQQSIYGPIAQFIRPAKRVAVFVVTVGDELERIADQRLQGGKLLEGYTLNAIGSAAADAAADALAEYLRRNEASADEGVTLPFSPGYCGMPLDQQRILFSIVDAAPIGVRLSESMIMHPVKSVSGLIGIGDRKDVAEHGVPCQWCELTDCKMRRACPE